MRNALNALLGRYHRITIPTIQVAFALSLMLHALVLSGWLPSLPRLPYEDSLEKRPGNSLAVRLAPPPSIASAPASAPAILSQPAPEHGPPPPKSAPPPPATPRVLTVERASPSSAALPPTETPRPPAKEDLASFIEARRRAREPAPASQPAPQSAASQLSLEPLPDESEQARLNRIAAANLGLDRTPSFGGERDRGGGIFQIMRMGYDSAEFLFYGWNKHINRNTEQMISVDRGSNATIELAVARKMIAIIREHESGDFLWTSRRLGRSVTLSARVADNAALEEFLQRDFFPNVRR